MPSQQNDYTWQRGVRVVKKETLREFGIRDDPHKEAALLKQMKRIQRELKLKKNQERGDG